MHVFLLVLGLLPLSSSLSSTSGSLLYMRLRLLRLCPRLPVIDTANNITTLLATILLLCWPTAAGPAILVDSVQQDSDFNIALLLVDQTGQQLQAAAIETSTCG